MRQRMLPACFLRGQSQRLTLSMLGLIVAWAGAANAEDWGTLKGRFVYGGDPPAATKLKADKDPEVCGAHELFQESLVVDPSTKGIANVIMFLHLERGDKAPPIHPDFAATPAEARIDNVGCRFEPHVLVVRSGQPMIIGNKDPVGHNTKIDSIKNAQINPIVAANSEIKHKLAKEERMPVRVSCSIHTWMQAWIVVKDSPYATASKADGSFEIANLPVGKWTFQVWQEANSGTNITQVERGGKSEAWKKGRVELEIKPGDNDLGEIVIPASVFKK